MPKKYLITLSLIESDDDGDKCVDESEIFVVEDQAVEDKAMLAQDIFQHAAGRSQLMAADVVRRAILSEKYHKELAREEVACPTKSK
jgi:hypothetical protein